MSFLDNMTTATTDVSGLCYNIYAINPQTLFPQMEAGILASFYERWECHRWRLVYKPSTVNTTPGDFWVVPEPDVTDTVIIKGAVLNVQNITDNSNRLIIPYQGGLKDSDNKSPWFKPMIKKLWTSPNVGHDPSQVFAGSVAVGVMQPTGVNLTTGQMFLEIDLTLSGKFIDDFSNTSAWEALPAASPNWFGNKTATSLSGRFQTFMYPTPNSNSYNITLNGRFLFVAKVAVNVYLQDPTLVVGTTPPGGTVTINNLSVGTPSGNAIGIIQATIDVSGATTSFPAILTVGFGSTTIKTIIPATAFCIPIDSGAVNDKIVKTPRIISSELDLLRKEMADIRLAIGEKPQIIEIILECKHKRTLYEPLGSYKSLRAMLGDESVDSMDDTAIQTLLKNFNFAPKLSQ